MTLWFVDTEASGRSLSSFSTESSPLALSPSDPEPQFSSPVSPVSSRGRSGGSAEEGSHAVHPAPLISPGTSDPDGSSRGSGGPSNVSSSERLSSSTGYSADGIASGSSRSTLADTSSVVRCVSNSRHLSALSPALLRLAVCLRGRLSDLPTPVESPYEVESGASRRASRQMRPGGRASVDRGRSQGSSLLATQRSIGKRAHRWPLCLLLS
eukprot:COSAG04_NODE_3186_length_3075_cov_2.017809_4_plen_211_part_00